MDKPKPLYNQPLYKAIYIQRLTGITGILDGVIVIQVLYLQYYQGVYTYGMYVQYIYCRQNLKLWDLPHSFQQQRTTKGTYLAI